MRRQSTTIIEHAKRTLFFFRRCIVDTLHSIRRLLFYLGAPPNFSSLTKFILSIPIMILGVFQPLINPTQVIHYKAHLPLLGFATHWQAMVMLFAGFVIIYFLFLISKLKKKNEELEAFNFDLNRELVEKAVLEKKLRDQTKEMEKNLNQMQKEEKES